MGIHRSISDTYLRVPIYNIYEIMLCRPSDVVPVGILVSLPQSVYIFLSRSEWECR